MKEEKIRRAVYIIALVLGGGALAYLFFKHALLALMPFLIAWGIAFSVRPLAARIGKKVRLPVGALRAVLAGLISLAFICALSLAAWALASELWRLLSGLGDGSALRGMIERISSFGLLGELFESFGDTLADVFYNLLSSAAAALGTAITAWLGAVPKIILFIIVTVIASVYFALDLDRINAFVKSVVPKKLSSRLSELRCGFFTVGVKYLRSYLLLMLLTFAVMLIGLMILARPYALLLAFIIAALDVLPVLGVGTVLLPWSIYELALGERGVGVGLIVLFLLYQLMRQLAEPKIIGKQLGVHPLLSLLLLYVSYTVFGIGGILLVPIAVVVINAVCKNNASEVEKRSVTEHDGA